MEGSRPSSKSAAVMTTVFGPNAGYVPLPAPFTHAAYSPAALHKARDIQTPHVGVGLLANSQNKFEARALPASDISCSDCDEPDLREHPLRSDVRMAGRRPERPQPVLVPGNPAHLAQSGGR